MIKAHRLARAAGAAREARKVALLPLPVAPSPERRAAKMADTKANCNLTDAG